MLSPSACKHFLNPLLNCISQGKVELQVATTYCGTIAVADDILFLADTSESLQCLLDVQGMYTKQERYTVSKTKTKVMIFNQKSVDSKIKFSLNRTTLEQVNIYKHLGITRQSSYRSSNDLLMEERIQSARGAAYALMAAGLHGHNGINLEVSVNLWRMYVLPRLLYGLESMRLTKLDLSKPEGYQ